jgi:hypothetical protein
MNKWRVIAVSFPHQQERIFNRVMMDGIKKG